jgi:uncharacterized protein (TIGR01777 family)
MRPSRRRRSREHIAAAPDRAGHRRDRFHRSPPGAGAHRCRPSGHRAGARSGEAATLNPPFRLITGLSQLPDDTTIDAIVNLAGEPIANGLWTVGKRHRILASRLRMTGNVVRLIKRLARKPAVLINASAVGWYGLQDDETLTEAADGRPCFTRSVCADWERAAVQAERFGVRVVRLRIGLVLGTEGGMLANLLTPFEYGLGGPIGSGRQWMSWIERDDLVRLIAHAIATSSLTGAVNATAPEPVRNATFARELGRALHRPAFLRLPAAPLRLLGGDMAEELLLGGQRVVPDKALKHGFVFRYPLARGARRDPRRARQRQRPRRRT